MGLQTYNSWDEDKSKEADGDMLKRLSTDGMRWAEEFIKVCPGAANLDKATVFGWFANAIELAKASRYKPEPAYPLAVQSWFHEIPMMQQSVLLSAIRGPDGFHKHHPVKPLLRWYRRCVLMSAFDGRVLYDPAAPGGGSFTGPSIEYIGDVTWQHQMKVHVDSFIHARDEMHLHYYMHAAHAFEILGYKHPDHKIAGFWRDVYTRMVLACHMQPESEAEMDARLGDNKDQWLVRSDTADSERLA